MKIQFRKTEKTPSADIADGSFKRTFIRSEQPFEVTPEEWAILTHTGLFEPATEDKKQPPPPSPAQPATPGNSDQK